MPIYEYQCDACGHVFEHFTFGDDKSASMSCPRCQKPEARKIFSAFSSACGTSEGGGCGGGKTGFS
jgi:putative FmdB family regulatory protein